MKLQIHEDAPKSISSETKLPERVSDKHRINEVPVPAGKPKEKVSSEEECENLEVTTSATSEESGKLGLAPSVESLGYEKLTTEASAKSLKSEKLQPEPSVKSTASEKARIEPSVKSKSSEKLIPYSIESAKSKPEPYPKDVVGLTDELIEKLDHNLHNLESTFDKFVKKNRDFIQNLVECLDFEKKKQNALEDDCNKLKQENEELKTRNNYLEMVNNKQLELFKNELDKEINENKVIYKRKIHVMERQLQSNQVIFLKI